MMVEYEEGFKKLVQRMLAKDLRMDGSKHLQQFMEVAEPLYDAVFNNVVHSNPKVESIKQESPENNQFEVIISCDGRAMFNLRLHLYSQKLEGVKPAYVECDIHYTNMRIIFYYKNLIIKYEIKLRSCDK